MEAYLFIYFHVILSEYLFFRSPRHWRKPPSAGHTVLYTKAAAESFLTRVPRAVSPVRPSWMVRMSCLTRQHCWFFFFLVFTLLKAISRHCKGCRCTHGVLQVMPISQVILLLYFCPEPWMKALPPGRYFSIFTIISDYGNTCWKWRVLSLKPQSKAALDSNSFVFVQKKTKLPPLELQSLRGCCGDTLKPATTASPATWGHNCFQTITNHHITAVFRGTDT